MRSGRRPDRIDGVLVVEELAHRAQGHFPNRFMELAEGFASCGVTVETLTSTGWFNAPPDRAPDIPVRRYSRASMMVLRLANRLQRAHRDRRTVVDLLRCAVLVREVRRNMRRMGVRTTAVVVVGMWAPPVLLPVLVRSGSWVVHVFDDEPRCTPWWASVLSRRSRRSRRGGGVTIAVPTPEWVGAYRRFDVHAVHLPLAGIRPAAPVADAKQRLGIPPDRRVALVFGAPHREKDGPTVATACRLLSNWQLLVVGRGVSTSEFNGDGWTVPPVLIDGFVDGATRAAAFEAADAVVLGFVAGYRRNSGTFMDAMAHGVPVVVSSDSLAAELTERYGVGVTFAAGDPDSLRQALGRVPTEIDPAALPAIRSAMSNEAVAQAHLTVLASGTSQPA